MNTLALTSMVKSLNSAFVWLKVPPAQSSLSFIGTFFKIISVVKINIFESLVALYFVFFFFVCWLSFFSYFEQESSICAPKAYVFYFTVFNCFIAAIQSLLQHLPPYTFYCLCNADRLGKSIQLLVIKYRRGCVTYRSAVNLVTYTNFILNLDNTFFHWVKGTNVHWVYHRIKTRWFSEINQYQSISINIIQ